MKKRLVLGAIAILLSLGTYVSRPVYACVAEPDCDPWDCQDMCAALGKTGVCNTCTGQCRCL